MLIDVKLLVWVRKATRVMATAGWLDSFIGTLYGGIDPSIPGMGGRDCALHVPFRVKILEITGVIVYMAFLYVWTAKTLTPVTEDDVRVMKERDSRLGGNLKKVALMLLSLVFGMELTFKIVTGRLLFVLNPCHALTIVQLYLLCVSPSKWSVSVYRVTIHNLFGAFLGVLFAVTNTRQFPGQIPVYWTQHVLICSIPLYIMYLWGPRCVEQLSDWSWVRVSILVFGHYHHHILLPVSELTYLNLNFMMCPPPNDPFGGPYYRAIHIVLMTGLLMVFGKLYSALSLWIIKAVSTNSKQE